MIRLFAQVGRVLRAGTFVLAFAGLAALSPANAQSSEPKNLDDLLNRVREGQDIGAGEIQRKVASFKKASAAQRSQLLASAKASVAAEEAKSNRLEKTFQNRELELGVKGRELEEGLGVFSELFGLLRGSAGDLREEVQDSLVTAEFPGRTDFLRGLAESSALPSIDDMEKFWFLLMQEVAERGRVSQFDASVAALDGTKSVRRITRVGPFNVIADGEYLRWLPDTNELAELGRQPAGQYLSAAENVEESEGVIVRAAIDPSRGQILSLLVQTPTLIERAQLGGIVGYVIIVLGILGVLSATGRIMGLSSTLSGVRRQARRGTGAKNNALGRIFAVYEDNRNADVDTLELKLEEAVLRETPAVTKGLSMLNLLAGVAPLLGLFGTVTGMIQTFQSITLFGTGDPKLMAGGISVALVTTVLGLLVAIPMLLLHGLAATRSRAILQIFDEQVATILAQHGR